MSNYEDYCALIKLLNSDDASRHSRKKQTANGNATAGVPYVVPLSMSHARKKFRKAPFVVQIS